MAKKAGKPIRVRKNVFEAATDFNFGVNKKKRAPGKAKLKGGRTGTWS